MIDWLKKNLAFIIVGIFIFCMLICFVSGCRYHKFRHPCPEPSITTNTVILHDTITHQIIDSFPYYISHNDTIIYTETIIQSVDTVEILRDYFALHVYNREWHGLDSLTKDSLLYVNIHDTITQNRSIGNKFQYKILRPQSITYTTVDNSVNYANYLYLGLDLPVYKMDNAEITALYAFRKGYIGGGYAPLAKGGSLKLGISLFKWQ